MHNRGKACKLQIVLRNMALSMYNNIMIPLHYVLPCCACDRSIAKTKVKTSNIHPCLVRVCSHPGGRMCDGPGGLMLKYIDIHSDTLCFLKKKLFLLYEVSYLTCCIVLFLYRMRRFKMEIIANQSVTFQ